MKLDKRDAMRLDLLVEETLGMAKLMLDEFYGQLWFTAEDRTCEIHFEATADMDADRKAELLSVSSTGRNAAAKGSTLDAYGRETMQYGIIHTPNISAPNVDLVPIWTLQNYRDDLSQARDGAADAALDELEKSIVARLADDIVVGVKGDRIDMIITKKF